MKAHKEQEALQAARKKEEQERIRKAEIERKRKVKERMQEARELNRIKEERMKKRDLMLKMKAEQRRMGQDKVEGYPQDKRRQRRLYTIYSIFILILLGSCSYKPISFFAKSLACLL